MGETTDLIGIYGAVDRAVENEPDLRARVSRLLPVYRDKDVRWFDELVAWTQEKREKAGATTDTPPFPEPKEALDGLAREEPAGRMRARRLFAMAVFLQAFPDRLEAEDWAPRARDSLKFRTLASNERKAERLLRLLGDEDLLPSVDDPAPGDADLWWERVLAVAGHNRLLADTALLGPRPCTGRLVMVDLPGGPRPAASLMTEFETDKIPFDRAIRFLDPENWRQCSDFWCEMKKVRVTDTGAHQYHEEVSTDCANKDVAWTVTAELDFRFRQLPDTAIPDAIPDTAITEYKLSSGHPKPGDDVLVDEGLLEVHRLGPDANARVRVTTTKRILFGGDHYTNGAALAMLMCVLGYDSVVEDLVFTCAADDTKTGTEFPGKSPATAKPGPKVRVPDFGPAIKAMADEVSRCADEWAEAAEQSSRKIAEGTYTADALVQDMAGIWVRSMREGATAVELGMRSVREAARTRAGEPPDPCNPP